ncbi:hypothetical protein D9615_007063 [Tricholomella constricta]|uniref:Uncharacterized protein n=1 Tax=Tricholomella constricta TaxID=117010 RepID=A0A8H5M2R0_9AGAR|nr:hypothetical protein D9615_007063 [Tricholomella constricta]
MDSHLSSLGIRLSQLSSHQWPPLLVDSILYSALVISSLIITVISTAGQAARCSSPPSSMVRCGSGTTWSGISRFWGKQKETSGVAALGVLTVIVLSSLRPVRVWAWGIFCWVQCVVLRPLRLIRVDNQMTLIHIPDCDAGFCAGQHLRVRVFFAGRAFEAHPLSNISVPATSWVSTCLRMGDVGAYFDDDNGTDGAFRSCFGKRETPGILLDARAVGGWTRTLNQYAERRERE